MKWLYTAPPALLLAALAFSGPAWAEGASVEDALSGFDNSDKSVQETEKEDKPAHSWARLSGAVAINSSYNYEHKAPAQGKTDFRGLSRLRGRLDARLDADLPGDWKARLGGMGYYDIAYSINGRDKYTSQVLEEYESEARLKEVYLLGAPLKSLDVKIGRQIVSWGKSDNIRVTDVLNPLDIREPGMVDIEDMREPLTMTRLDYYTGSWSLTAVAVHEIYFNRLPPYGGDFYPLDFRKPAEDIPASTPANTEYGLALGGVFPGFDVAFYLADFYDDNFSLKSAPVIAMTPAIYPPPPGVIPFTLAHNRLKMAGASMNKALGNFLAKMEMAWFDGLKFPLTDEKTFQRADGLLGVEYSGFEDVMISLEVAVRHMPNFDPAISQGPLAVKRTEWQGALRAQADFMNQRLHLLGLVSVMGENGSGGAFERVSVKYDLRDSLSATAGVVAYQAGYTPFLMKAGENDRAFLDVKYSF